MKYNDFLTDLQYSLENRDSEMLDRAYFQMFRGLKYVELVDDIELQKKGIDKRLHFANGKVVLLDEKKRRKDYGDILLEEYSVWETKKVGWLGRHMHADYVSYAFMDTGKLYVFPFLLLQRAWLKNHRNWLHEYGRVFAHNPSYRTSNIPVPTKVLTQAIMEAGQVELKTMGY